MSALESKGYVPCNELIDEAVGKVYADPNPAAPVSLPWTGGVLGTEGKILLLLGQRFGAVGVAAKGEGAVKKYKFYYSRESTGNWFTEVWPMWKVATLFAVLITYAAEFYRAKSGAGSLLTGILLLAAFGPRAVLAARNSVVAGRLSAYSYAREGFPLMVAGALGGLIMLEWSFVLPWNASEVVIAAKWGLGLLLMPFGLGDLLSRIMWMGMDIAGCAVLSVLFYQCLAGGMMRGWLETAFTNQLVLAEPEPGTWFHKLRTTGPNPISGVVMLILGLGAIGGIAMPFM